MSVCLHCNSRIGVEPTSTEKGAQVASELRDARREAKVPEPVVLGTEPSILARAFREHADGAKQETALALSLLTKIASVAGIRCGIAENVGRRREFPKDDQGHEKRALSSTVRDTGFEYRFAVFVELPVPAEMGGGTEQMSWYVHDSDLGLFAHLKLEEGWKGEAPREAQLERARSFGATWQGPTCP